MNLDDLRATKAVADLDLLPEDRLAVAAMVAAGYAHARKVKGGEPERITDTDRMDALGLPGWELSMNDAVECNAWELWHVHVCSGGRNDREWTLIGAGATPREAIDAAIASTDSHTLPTHMKTTPAPTGITDRTGREIFAGDHVSLDGNITADDSLGSLPNGWTFDESDVYQVYFDERISTWSLQLGVEPDTAYNRKYMSHAVSLLHSGAVTVVTPAAPAAAPPDSPPTPA